MRGLAITFAAFGWASAGMAQDQTAAVYTNMEDVYFSEEEGRTPVPWIGLEMRGEDMRLVDAFGEPAPPPAGLTIVSHEAERMIVTIAGVQSELRRARAVTCWALVDKGTGPDGSPDFHAATDLAMHDQGGRARLGGGETGAPETILRMRRVTWAKESTNRPSLVLYVHRPDAPEQAVSYAWADSDARFVGINLRWMQASCTIDRT